MNANKIISVLLIVLFTIIILVTFIFLFDTGSLRTIAKSYIDSFDTSPSPYVEEDKYSPSMIYNSPEEEVCILYEKEWICHDFLIDYYQYGEIEREQFLSPIVQSPIEPVSQEPTFHQIGETEETNETITMVTEENNKPYFNVSSYNRSALIHLLFFEACGGKTDEDIKEQRAIISVVFNRLLSGSYEHCYDASDIIFYQYSSGSYAFSPASDKDRFWNFKDENEKKDFERNYNQLAEKVDYVIEHGCTVPSNVLYFVSNKCYEENSYFKNNHKVYCVYDDTTFMTNEKP